MNCIVGATQLYKYLWYCNQENLEKNILDCGAAGKKPPLVMFYEQGYKTYGIDINEERIKLVEDFEKINGINLNIKLGDMRKLDYSDKFFSFLYSYNSIFHLTKKDTELAIKEFRRVTKENGLIFVNFLSKEDCLYGFGEDLGNGEFEQDEDGQKTVHSFYDDKEPDYLFKDCKIIHKEKRILERYIHNKKYRQSFLDYIVRI